MTIEKCPWCGKACYPATSLIRGVHVRCSDSSCFCGPTRKTNRGAISAHNRIALLVKRAKEIEKKALKIVDGLCGVIGCLGNYEAEVAALEILDELDALVKGAGE